MDIYCVVTGQTNQKKKPEVVGGLVAGTEQKVWSQCARAGFVMAWPERCVIGSGRLVSRIRSFPTPLDTNSVALVAMHHHEREMTHEC